MNKGLLLKQIKTEESKKDTTFKIDCAHFFFATGWFGQTGVDISVPIVVIYN